MSRLAPDIVYAVVEDVRRGRVFGLEEAPEDAVQSVVVVLRIESVVAGDAFRDGDSALLELGPVSRELDVVGAFGAMVGDEGLFFLHRKGTAQPEFDVTAVAGERALGYYRPTTSQAAFLNDQGQVALAFWADASHFPADLEGTPFDELVRRVRAALQ